MSEAIVVRDLERRLRILLLRQEQRMWLALSLLAIYSYLAKWSGVAAYGLIALGIVWLVQATFTQRRILREMRQSSAEKGVELAAFATSSAERGPGSSSDP